MVINDFPILCGYAVLNLFLWVNRLLFDIEKQRRGHLGCPIDSFDVAQAVVLIS